MATGAIISGPLSSVNALAANQMPDNDRLLYLLYPSQYPLFQKLYFAEGRKSKPVVNDTGEFNWFEDELYPHMTALKDAGIAGGAPTQAAIGIVAQIFQVNDIVLVEQTLQMLKVTAIANGSTTVASLDGTNITQATTGNLRKLASLNHEFAGVRNAVDTTPVEVSNYLTIFNESVGQTGRQQGSKTYTNGMTFAEKLEKKVEEMKAMYEHDFKFSTQMGTTQMTGADGNAYLATFGKGVLGFVTTNKVSYQVLTEDVLDNFFYQVFNTGGSKVKDHYCGGLQSMALQKIIKAKYQINPQPITTEYGVDLLRYRLTQGTVNIIWDPNMDGKFSSYGFTIDSDAKRPITMRYMADDDRGTRKFRIMKHVEANGSDGRIDKIMADIGIQIPNQEVHGVLYDAAA